MSQREAKDALIRKMVEKGYYKLDFTRICKETGMSFLTIKKLETDEKLQPRIIELLWDYFFYPQIERRELTDKELNDLFGEDNDNK